RQHQGEQDEHDDCPDIDKQLHQRDQLGAQHQIAAGQSPECHHQPQTSVQNLAVGHCQHSSGSGDQTHCREEHITTCHPSGSPACSVPSCVSSCCAASATGRAASWPRRT